MVSKETLLLMMNSLFNENYELETTGISFENNEFIIDKYGLIRGDLFFKIKEIEKAYHYHIEFQTKNDKTMVFRMFEYGYNKAKELSKNKRQGKNNELVIHIPRQLVIFIEENKKIKDELTMKIIFPEGEEVNYKVPIMKYWEYSDQDLLDRKLYMLLPLQLFKLRHELEKVKRKLSRDGNNIEELKKLILKVQKVANIVSCEGKDLFDKGKINGDDLHSILLAIDNLFKYLNRNYVDDESIEVEVEKMTRSLYDPIVAKKAKNEGKIEEKLKLVRNSIAEGLPVKVIAKITEMEISKVEELKKEMENEE